VGGVRVRQHVNPLSSRNMMVVPSPAWSELYPDASLPLVLDLGAGSGRFLLSLGEQDAARARNYLGIEIREPLVGRAAFWAEKKGLSHVRYAATNANVNAPAWLDAYPGPLALVCILHPDPHWCAGGVRGGVRARVCACAERWRAGSASTASAASCSPRWRARWRSTSWSAGSSFCRRARGACHAMRFSDASRFCPI
jgi:hypothetical protein